MPRTTFLAGISRAIAGSLISTQMTAQAFQFFFISWVISSAALGQWKRHTIDASGRGADGVRLCDLNRDGLPDVVTGWEESGHVRVYLHPGTESCQQPWPIINVAKLAAVEDAVAVDLDGDGWDEIISCHEGNEQSVAIHRLTTPAKQRPGGALANGDGFSQWESILVSACQGKSRWMFAEPVYVSGKLAGVMLGSKNPNGQLSWLAPPTQSTRPPNSLSSFSDWQLTQLDSAGWVMSLQAVDMNQDGAEDVVVSDRKGKKRGVFWLENPLKEKATHPSNWKRHAIGGEDFEVMFLHATPQQVYCATRNGKILTWQTDGKTWRMAQIPNPLGIQSGKAVALLSPSQLVFTANTGVRERDHGMPGVTTLNLDAPNEATNISGKDGIKFDRIEVFDVDEDGDLDILTCEERSNLGVIWYENPRN